MRGTSHISDMRTVYGSLPYMKVLLKGDRYDNRFITPA